MNEPLGDRSARGAFVTLAANVARRVLGFAARVVLARLLAPEDFGLAALALFVVNFGSQFQDAGFGAALIYFRDRVEERAGTSLWTTAALGTALAFLCALAAGPIARAFAEPRAAELITALGIMLFFNALAVTPLAMLRRDLRNTSLAIVELSAVSVGLGCGIALAALGWGARSLVLGTVAQSILLSAGAWLARPGRVARGWDRRLAAEMFQYGSYILAGGLVTFLVVTLDNALVQAWCGAEMLGYYVMAYGLAGLAASEVSGAAAVVLFPALSSVRDDPERLRLAFFRATRVTGAVALPLTAAVVVIGPSFIRIVLGRVWETSIPLMWILSIFGALRACFAGTGALFQACGRARTKFLLDLLQAAALVGFAFVWRDWGAVGVSWAVVASAGCTLGLALVQVGRLLGAGAPLRLLAGLFPSALCAVLAGAVVAVPAVAWLPGVDHGPLILLLGGP
ncbi:MAG: lipopolysaccharide biosynthesis protein, partial [Planctomycetes bacterium]|nr:lipopolysaccharide biosynthesis protein [Planctomycetota bacterium]